MKKIFLLLFLPLLFFACKRSQETVIADSISQSDMQAASDMNKEIQIMGDAIDSMIATPHINMQHHWDSVYHYHDSLFWHHHGFYSHENAHDDHSHTYSQPTHVPDYHQHHFYPGHEHDSMIIVYGTHHHDSTNYHHHMGHDMYDHHVLDSIHNLHNIHHP